jgi:hypothetical protein
MCGILGIVAPPGETPDVSPRELRAMRDAMTPRGPDGAVQQIHLPSGGNALASGLARQIAGSVQFVTPRGPSAPPAWSLHEIDASGRYTADYRAVGGRAYTKTWHDRARLDAAGRPVTGPGQPRFLGNGAGRIELAPDGWIARARLEDTLVVDAPGGVHVETRSTVRLESAAPTLKFVLDESMARR